MKVLFGEEPEQQYPLLLQNKSLCIFIVMGIGFRTDTPIKIKTEYLDERWFLGETKIFFKEPAVRCSFGSIQERKFEIEIGK